MLIGAIVTLPVSVGMSEETALPQDDEMGIEVLSISVSKLSRDTFGNANNPFSSFSFSNMQEGEGGTVVLSRLTTRPAASLTLLPEKCRLLSFKDDLDTDLLGSDRGGLGDQVFSRNRAVELLNTNERGVFGLRVRSARVPTRAAKRVNADVLLVFCSNDKAGLEQKADVLLQTNDTVVVGPVRLTFRAQPFSFNYRTNQVAGSSESPYWLASCLPEQGAAVTSVALLSEKSDEPILLIKNIGAEGNAASSSSTIHNDFTRSVGYGFRPPEDRKVTIKVRYYNAASLIEKHCLISTGLSP